MALVMPDDFNYADFKAQVAISYASGANYIAVGNPEGFEWFAAIPDQDVEPNNKFQYYTYDAFERFNIAMHIDEMPEQYVAMKTWILGVDWTNFVGYHIYNYHFTLLHALMQAQGFVAFLSEQDISAIEDIFNAAQNRYTYMYYFIKLADDNENLVENQTFMRNLIQSCYNNEDYEDERSAYFVDMDNFLKPTEFELGATCKAKLEEIQATVV